MQYDKDKVFSRAKSWAYNNGLRGGMEYMDFGVPVQAYVAGYRAALRDISKRAGKPQTDKKQT